MIPKEMAQAKDKPLSEMITPAKVWKKDAKVILADFVKDFIQDVLDEVSAFGKFEKLNGQKTNGLKYRIKKRAGEELTNHSPLCEIRDWKEGEFEEWKKNNFEDTSNSKGCGIDDMIKMIDKQGCGKKCKENGEEETDQDVVYPYAICGRSGYLCPECSKKGDEE